MRSCARRTTVGRVRIAGTVLSSGKFVSLPDATVTVSEHYTPVSPSNEVMRDHSNL